MMSAASCRFPALGPSGDEDPRAGRGVASERLVGIGYEDVVASSRSWSQVSATLDEMGATGVTVSVGRPEWTAFPWPDHSASWSAPVRTSGEDYVAKAVDVLKEDGNGRRRSITLTIDVLAPRRIAQRPELGALATDGTRSTEVLGPAALVGEGGEQIADLCGAVARRYDVDRVALAELFVESGYGPDDLEVFRRMTGEQDWPRDASGAIDTAAESLGAFRSAVVTDVVRRCAAQVHPTGKAVDVDVRANWTGPGSRPDSGHDYAELLETADHLTVWNYFGISQQDPSYSRQITKSLADSVGAARLDRVTMSVGLWAGQGDDSREVISPEQLEEGLLESATNGLTSVSVTPLSLLDDSHRRAVARTWNPGGGSIRPTSGGTATR